MGEDIVVSRRAVVRSLGLASLAGAGVGADTARLFYIPLKNRQKSQGSLRFAFGMFVQESNTFCPETSPLERFQHGTLALGEAITPMARRSGWYIGGIARAAEKLGIQLYPTVAAAASPYGVVERSAYEYITGQLYDRLESAGKLDGIVFSFHGAMVSETTMDPEGEIISRMRSIVGPHVPITCTFDFHCKVSQRMIENADAFFYNNENPHVDSFDRGIEATEVCFRIARGELAPVMVVKKPGMLPPTVKVRPPASGPLVDIFKRAFEMERDPRVVNINIGPGFPWCDVPDAGTNVVLVVHRDRQLAEDLAGELAERLWRVRHEFIPSLVPYQEAVGRAIRAEHGPVVLVDVADNPGGGTTQDSNWILRELYSQNVRDAAVAVIHQPEVVRRCIDAGVGTDVVLDLGCPHRTIGEPIHMAARVKTISDGVYSRSSPPGEDGYGNLGRAAVIEKDGIEIVVTERTHPTNFPEIFHRHGIDPAKKKVLVIKTLQIYSEPYFRSVARQFIDVDAPGQASPNLKHFAWKNIPRPMYPIDDA